MLARTRPARPRTPPVRRTLPRQVALAAGLALALGLLLLAASGQPPRLLAQEMGWRLVQGPDGTIYLLHDNVKQALTPRPLGQDALDTLPSDSPLDDVLPVGAIATPRVRVATATPTLTRTPTPSPTPIPTPQRPLYDDLALDEARGRLYAVAPTESQVAVFSVPDLSLVGSVPLPAGSRPFRLRISPDGAELAISLAGLNQIGFVNLDALQLVDTIALPGPAGANQPHDLVYGLSDRLYVAEESGTPHHLLVVDRVTGAEVGRGPDYYTATSWLAMAADGQTLFLNRSDYGERYDVSGDTPQVTGVAALLSFRNDPLVVRPDGSAVYTSSGQVWAGDFTHLLGRFLPAGSRLDYVPATEHLYLTARGSAASDRIAEVDALTYQTLRTFDVPTASGALRATSDGAWLFVAVPDGIYPINLAAPTP